MNEERLLESIQRHEGYRELPYLDSMGYTTVGWGHLIHHLQLSTLGYFRTLGELFEWLSSPVQHRIWLESDIAQAESDARRYIGDAWARLSDARQEVLVELAFQLGATRLGGFKLLREAIIASHWVSAHGEMMSSRWAEQTPKRATELASRMLAG